MTEDTTLSAFAEDAEDEPVLDDEAPDAGADRDERETGSDTAGSESPTAADAGDAEERRSDTDDGVTAEQPTTPTITYAASPDGATCAACGETVRERWHAGEGGVDGTGDATEQSVVDRDALVCSDCKQW